MAPNGLHLVANCALQSELELKLVMEQPNYLLLIIISSGSRAEQSRGAERSKWRALSYSCY